MLAASLQYVNFDKASGTLYPFENVFYPLTIGEGKYAFLSYMEQMENTGGLVADKDNPIMEELTQDRGKRDTVLAVMGSLSYPTTQDTSQPTSATAKVLPILAHEMALDSMAENAEPKNHAATAYTSPFDTTEGQEINEPLTTLPLDWSEGDRTP